MYDSSPLQACSDPSSEEMDQNLAQVRRITWIGLWANLFLTALKFLAGVFGHSSVLVADSIHSLSDLATDSAILIGARFWGQPADRDHPYGHAKIETLVTLLIGIALILVAFGLVYQAVETLVKMVRETSPFILPNGLPLAAAVISIVVKEYLYQITARTGIRVKSSAVVANAWHHRSDALSSIPAALAVGACLCFGEKYAFLDPVGTVVVGLMIVYAAWEIMHPTFDTLLDAGTTQAHCDEIAETILSFPEVRSLHKLRTRLVGPTGISVDVHIQVDPQMTVETGHDLCHRIQDKLEKGRNVMETLIHLEPAAKE